MTTWQVIHNPTSGNGKSDRHWPRIEKLLKKYQIRYDYHATAYPYHAFELTHLAIDQGHRNFIVVGGDGTANEVANSILTQEKTGPGECGLAIVPIGRGNDWASSLGIRGKYKHSIEAIKNENFIFLDAGKVIMNKEVRYFINMFGMGFDGYVARYANSQQMRGKSGGKMAYIFYLLQCLYNYRDSYMEIEIDGVKTEGHIFTLAVGIHSTNGGGIKQLPNAKFNDGILDVMVAKRLSKWKVVKNVKNLFDGSFSKLEEVSLHTCTRFSAISNPPVPIEVDGEFLGNHPVEINILPAALKVIGFEK